MRTPAQWRDNLTRDGCREPWRAVADATAYPPVLFLPLRRSMAW